MAHEVMAGFAVLSTILGGDATLTALVSGVYRDVAPDGTAPDWLIIGHQSGQDVLSGVATRIMSGNLYRVLAVGPETDDVNLYAIANRVDALLQPAGQPLRSQVVNTGVGAIAILACYREQPLALPSTVPGSGSGAAWLNVGGLYRLEM